MYKRILIVVDEDAAAHAALTEGLGVARTHAAQVVFFHVLPNYVMPIAEAPPLAHLSPEQHRREAEFVAARVLSQAESEARSAGVASTGAVGSDADAATCIARAAAARQCDLVVIGSHGRNAIQRLIFGSTVTRLIPMVGVPLLICKAPDRSAKFAHDPPPSVDATQRNGSQGAAP